MSSRKHWHLLTTTDRGPRTGYETKSHQQVSEFSEALLQIRIGLQRGEAHMKWAGGGRLPQHIMGHSDWLVLSLTLPSTS